MSFFGKEESYVVRYDIVQWCMLFCVLDDHLVFFKLLFIIFLCEQLKGESKLGFIGNYIKSMVTHLKVFPISYQFTELYQTTISVFIVPGFPGSVVILLWYLSETIISVYIMISVSNKVCKQGKEKLLTVPCHPNPNLSPNNPNSCV